MTRPAIAARLLTSGVAALALAGGVLAVPATAHSQARGAAAVAELRAGLGVHTRVLLVAAHPDDEDTQLITWLTRGHRAETAYLSLTRGDGGQNLIGNELGEALGVIRTEELLAARRIDGAHQYFTRAFDFGFSKNTTDTYAHWPHDSVLGDVIRVIRAFKPDIIVSVFSGTPRDGHGHHQVAGLLAREAYDLAADTVRFPTRVYGAAWTPLKFYRSARFRRETATLSMNVGEYNDNLGQSYAELAAESRSQHKSQGFGTARRLGTVMDYVAREATRVNAETPADKERSMFDGLDTTRVVTDADKDALALAESAITVTAVAQRERVALGDSVKVDVSVYRRGVLDSAASKSVYVRGERLTQPYWLERPRTGDLFWTSSQTISDDLREQAEWLRVPVTVPGRPAPVVVPTRVVYHYADPVRGDVERPLVTTPGVAITFARPVSLVRAEHAFARVFEIALRSSRATPCTVSVRLTLPAGLTADSIARHVTLASGATRSVTFRVSGKLPAGTHELRATASDGRATYDLGYDPIEYDHITPERLYRKAVVQLRSIDVALAPNLTVGYVQGVGDNIAPALRELGIPVTILDPAAFPETDFSRFTTIVVGPRAYQASATLLDNNAFLLDYARRGGHVVVQYGQYEMQEPGAMPYPVSLQRPATRVTEENAPVRITDPRARFLRTPNVITEKDFDGWVQERALYMPSTFDPRYATMLGMHDTGEPESLAGILTTPLGKGRYTYVTLSLFRQVPAGVSGGVRVLANLLTPATP